MLLVPGRCCGFVLVQVWPTATFWQGSADFSQLIFCAGTFLCHAFSVRGWCSRRCWGCLVLCIATIHSCCTEQVSGQFPRKALALSQGSHHSVVGGLNVISVLGHCSSRRRQLQPQVFGNWKPSASSLLLPAHSENLNLWLDNMTWSCHSTAKASLSLGCRKSRSACHAAVAAHRRWWSLKDRKRIWPGTCYVLASQAVLILHPCVIH